MPRPGEWLLSEQPVEINSGRRTLKLKVRNTGDRPIQIGSHYHFFEANRALDFDRPQAMGMHLNIPGGLAIRIEPGDEREVELVEYGGTKRVIGFNNLVNGGLTGHWTVKQALERARALEFKGMEKLNQEEADIISREATEEQGNRSKHAAPVEKGTDESRNKDGGKQEEQR
jgi:urease subunit beta/urease subunit gamma/beta